MDHISHHKHHIYILDLGIIWFLWHGCVGFGKWKVLAHNSFGSTHCSSSRCYCMPLFMMWYDDIYDLWCVLYDVLYDIWFFYDFISCFRNEIYSVFNNVCIWCFMMRFVSCDVFYDPYDEIYGPYDVIWCVF